MFGREVELARIEQLLETAADGASGVAIEGAPGVGKTALWQAAIASARARGFHVLATAPCEPDMALAFVGLTDLFDNVGPGDLDLLPEPQRRALAAALTLEKAVGSPADSQALPRAVLAMLRVLAARGPLVVAIDDEQWLDGSSARVLAFALTRLRNEHVSILLTRRSASEGALWAELSRGFGAVDGAQRRLGSLRLEPLDAVSLRALLQARLDQPISPPLSSRIHQLSGGNPLFALAIADGVRSRAGAVRELDVRIPRTLGDAIAQRLATVDAAARDPLLVAASLSHPTVSLIQSALPEFTFSDLDSAERNGVIEIVDGRLRFTHPLLASTHYTRSDSDRRRALHRTLAEVVSDGVDRANHLALGAEAPNFELANAIEQGATEAARRGAPEVAARLLEQAARLTPVDSQEASRARAVAAAEQHWAAGDVAVARGLLESELSDLPGGPMRARALKVLARIRTDNFEASARLFEEALNEAGHDHRLAAEIETLLAEVRVNSGDLVAGLAHDKAAVAHAEATGDRALIARTLAGQALTHFLRGDGVQLDLLDRAIKFEDHDADVPSSYLPSAALGYSLLWSDQPDAARPLLELAFRRAEQRSEELELGILAAHLAGLERNVGNRAQAERYLAEAQAMRHIGDDQADTYLLTLDAANAAWFGDLEVARASADSALAFARRMGDCFASLAIEHGPRGR